MCSGRRARSRSEGAHVAVRAVQQEALRVVTNGHDDVAVATYNGAACAAGAELDLGAKEPM